MTARSELAGVLEIEPSLYRRDNDPLCVQRVRDGLVNGVLHKADSASQVIVNWHPIASSVSPADVDYATGHYPEMERAAAGTFYQIQPGTWGIVDMPIFGSGELYELRIRSAWGAGDHSFADPPPAGNVTVRIFFYPELDDATGPLGIGAYHEQAEDFVWEGTFATGTVGHAGAVISGTTRGPGGYANKLVLTSDVAAEWPIRSSARSPSGVGGRLTVNAPNGPAGADRAPTTVLRCHVGVVASIDTDPTPGEVPITPLLRSLHAQGFVGVAA